MDAIVNVTPDWGIGYRGRLLVSVSADLRRFRRLTEGKTLILGRKTLETFPQGKPLPRRRHIILSRTPGYSVEGATVVSGLPALFQALAKEDPDALAVVGGQSVYRLLLDYCSRVCLTRTLCDLPADRFFPDLDALPNWVCTEEGPVHSENGVQFQYLTYQNKYPKSIPTEKGTEP